MDNRTVKLLELKDNYTIHVKEDHIIVLLEGMGLAIKIPSEFFDKLEGITKALMDNAIDKFINGKGTENNVKGI